MPLFTNQCVHVNSTTTGALAPVRFSGQAWSQNGTMLVDITTSAIPWASSDIRSGQRWRSDGRRLLTKAAINAADLVLDNGMARTLDGKQYAVTLAAAGATAKHIEGLPYDAAGRLKVNEV